MNKSDLTHIEKIETVLVAHLKDRLDPDYFIDSFPDKLEGFDAGNMEKLVLVQYSGSQYSDAVGTGAGDQSRRAEFALHLQLKSNNQPVRAARAIEKIRLALQGQRIEGCQINMIRDGLIDHDTDSGVWKYLIVIGLSMPAVAMPHQTIAPFISTFSKGS